MDLFDEKGSCQICSTSTVQRRFDRGSYAVHARAHKEAGDPVELSCGNPGSAPDLFKIVIADKKVA